MDKQTLEMDKQILENEILSLLILIFSCKKRIQWVIIGSLPELSAHSHIILQTNTDFRQNYYN